jgi:hypothetical protein
VSGVRAAHASADVDDLLNAAAAARQFLTVLDEDAEKFSFQTFPDREGASEEERRVLSCIVHGALEEVVPRLTALNERGAGIFVTVNATDLRGRSAENIVGVRALFADFDGAPLPRAWPLEPHITVESSPGRWLASGIELAEFRVFQAAIAAHLGSDPKIIDLPRVMRLPGFTHRKGAPFVTRIESLVPGQPYDRETLLRAFPQARARESREQRSGREQHQQSGHISKGGRNAALTSLGGSMRRRGMSRAAIEAALLEENQAKCSPPLPEDEVRRIAESVSKYEPRAQAGPDPEPQPLVVPPASTWAARTPPERSWTWQGWIPGGRVTLLMGDGGVGKSIVAQTMLSACASGRGELFGWPMASGVALGIFSEEEQDELERRHCGAPFA